MKLTESNSVNLAFTSAKPEPRVKALEKAVEFAEYMAKGADDLLRSIYSCQEAENKVDAAPRGDQLVAAEIELEKALEVIGEYVSVLRNDVYEFRKRRDRIPAIQSGMSLPNTKVVPNEKDVIGEGK